MVSMRHGAGTHAFPHQTPRPDSPFRRPGRAASPRRGPGRHRDQGRCRVCGPQRARLRPVPHQAAMQSALPFSVHCDCGSAVPDIAAFCISVVILSGPDMDIPAFSAGVI